MIIFLVFFAKDESQKIIINVIASSKIMFLFLEKLLYERNKHNNITSIEVIRIIYFLCGANLIKIIIKKIFIGDD